MSPAARTSVLLLSLALLVPGCGRKAPPEVVTVTARSGIDLASVVFAPAEVVRGVVRRAPGRVEVLVERAALGARALVVRAPGACPARVALGADPGADPRSVALSPWIDVGEDRPQIGFDTPFEIEVKPGCREAVAGRVSWRQIDGAPLAELREEKNGFRLRARTAAFARPSPSDPLPWGIVPLSPATRGAATLEVTWRGAGPEVKRRVVVAAAARASGVPSLGFGQRVLLGGSGWHVKERPPAGKAEVAETHAPSFLADVTGRWVLEDAQGATLALRVGRHADTPLDCGRSDCHASAARGAEGTRMTRVLVHGLSGALGPGYDASCAMACHTVGEPGLPDGGFARVSTELGGSLPPVGPEAWSALPRALRRLGGVGCTACHGPGAIPERSARWTILRSDVCAVCHDSPPRYGHVAAWQRSRMARADASPEARASEACAACHTTSGFLSAIGVRPWAASLGGPDEPRGIGCAACHAPHAAATERALVRIVPSPESLGEIANLGPSGVCLRCHAALAGEGAPSASAANLWLGRLSKEDARRPAPHARIDKGCLGCHAGGAPGLSVERGAGHTFQVDRARCQPCHECPKEERPGKDGKRVKERAGALFAILRARGIVKSARDTAPHAAMEIEAAPGSREARAAARVLSVVEDRGAGAHNAGAARALLDEAEALLKR